MIKGLINYLFLYNILSCFGWIFIFLYTFYIHKNSLIDNHYKQLIFLLKYVQTFSVLEIVNACLGTLTHNNTSYFYLSGITSSFIFTTIIQVSSRLLICWGILNLYPSIVLKTTAFFSMSYAWSITEIVRYSYYANNLKKKAPSILVWLRYCSFCIQVVYNLILRYNLFYILYPLGTSSEILLIWKTLPYIDHEKHVYSLVLKGILMFYVPGTYFFLVKKTLCFLGFYIMYKHMIHQRRK